MEQIAVKITEDDSNNLIERNAVGNLLSFPGTKSATQLSTTKVPWNRISTQVGNLQYRHFN